MHRAGAQMATEPAIAWPSSSSLGVARYTSADACRLPAECDGPPARPPDDRLVRDRLRRRPRGRVPRHGPPRPTGRRGRRDPRQRDDHRRRRGADRRSCLPRHRPVGRAVPRPHRTHLPAAVLGSGRLRRDRHRRHRGVPVRAVQARALPALGGHHRARPVHDAGDRPLGQLLQPGAVRPADDRCRGASRSTAPTASPTTRVRRSRWRPRASTRCSCTSRCPA